MVDNEHVYREAMELRHSPGFLVGFERTNAFLLKTRGEGRRQHRET